MSAYRITVPNLATYADGLASYGPGEAPPTWFIDGTGYIAADHPRLPYYQRTDAYTVEPVAEIPQDYKGASARLTKQDVVALSPPAADAA